MNVVAPVPKPAPTSAPGVHEISTFLPGRLEFEHELDNEAEDLVKDMEFGVVMKYGGGQMPVDENDVDVLARVKLEEERRKGRELSVDGVESVASIPNGHDSSSSLKAIKKVTDEAIDASTETDPNAEEPTLPPPDESDDSVDFKLTLLQIYIQRVDKRLENKAIIFDRGLLEYRKVCLGLIRSHCCVSLYLNCITRCKPTKRNVRRMRKILRTVFGLSRSFRLQKITRLSSTGLSVSSPSTFLCVNNEIIHIRLDESVLRMRIQELQLYRRMGLTTAADIERYESDVAKRVRVNFITLSWLTEVLQVQAKAQLASNYSERLQFESAVALSRPGPDARRGSAMSVDEEGHKDGEAASRPPV